jgi:hypothetical protein
MLLCKKLSLKFSGKVVFSFGSIFSAKYCRHSFAKKNFSVAANGIGRWRQPERVQQSDAAGVESTHLHFVRWVQGCQIFLVTTYQNGENMTRRPQNVPNDHKIYQMDIKFTNIFHYKTLQNLPKLGIWV